MSSQLLSTQLSSVVLPSLRPMVMSAWHGHLSFAHWVVQAVKPKVIVELGTHNGLSYSAFCNAIASLKLDAKCYAVDTWEGDEHAGAYSSSVYDDLKKFNDRNFSNIGVMIKSYFDQALSKFDDGSVDILHIDGLHTYEAVKHNFETWRPKLSDRGVILFHDTEVRGGGFGVWKLWAELTSVYPGFNFLHSAGLGVLAVGKNQPEEIISLCNSSEEDSDEIRRRFERLSDVAKVYGTHLLMSSYQGLNGANAPNVARNKPIIQSSNFECGSARTSPTDGIKDGSFGFHTNQEKNPWIIIDLQQLQKLSRVVIFNRISDGCRERARHISVAASRDGMEWTTIYRHDGVPFGGIDGNPLTFDVDTDARLVRFWLEGTEFFHLDQVEIY